jgi:uncharacterized membrane protein
MVIAMHGQIGLDAQFIIRPTLSLTPKTMLQLYAAIVVVTLGINMGFVFAGAWMVLVFGGLELVVLGAAFWLVYRASQREEIVSINGDELRITKRDHARITNEWKYLRYWTHVLLEREWKEWYPSRLYIRSKGKSVEIGKCLNNEERKDLAEQLKEVINGYLAEK